MSALSALSGEARKSGTQLLWARWAALDRVDPITTFESQVCSEGGVSMREDCHVAAHQIASVDGEYQRWGLINNRAFTYDLNMQSLGRCDSREDYSLYLRDLGETRLIGHPGPLGPLFTTGSDGRHRTHIMKALALPRLLVRHVEFPEVPQHVGDRATVFFSTRYYRPLAPLRSGRPLSAEDRAAEDLRVAEEARRAALKERRDAARRVRNRSVLLAHLDALQRRGIIADLDVREGYEQTAAEFTVQWDLPAHWALETPARVEHLSRRYARSYPEFATTDTGRAMCNRRAWLEYLGVDDPEAAVDAAAPKARSKRRFSLLLRPTDRRQAARRTRE